jgi:hypothetical protein
MTGSGLKPENFAFTVEALGTPWDVYRLTDKEGKAGMIAFREINGRWEIGFFRAGEFTPEEVVRELTSGQN